MRQRTNSTSSFSRINRIEAEIAAAATAVTCVLHEPFIKLFTLKNFRSLFPFGVSEDLDNSEAGVKSLGGDGSLKQPCCVWNRWMLFIQ